MSSSDETTVGTEPAEGQGLDAGADAYRMTLQVDISDAGPCKKHVRVVVPRADIEHYYNSAVKELVTSAAVPGFRPGHVPRKLVEKRFRREVGDNVKQRVLMESLEQLADEHELDAINEPNLDVENIEIPEVGDLQYEFDVEVRPEFDLPNYNGVEIKRQVRSVSDADVKNYIGDYLAQFGQLVPVDTPAGPGDFIEANINFRSGNEELGHLSNQSIRMRPGLRFRDAEVLKFDELMNGVSAGEQRVAQTTISLEAPKVELRGEPVEIRFDVTDVKRLQLPELTPEFLSNLGVDSEEELRKQCRDILERQSTYQQRQSTRRQVLEKITESATWELPESLVRRQVENALRREILEMQQAGFTDEQIRARETELLQRQISMTRQALKEHFVLDKIATQEKVEVTPEDVEMEIMYMAMQRGESPRKMRARLEKQGLMENLLAQILERKAVDIVLDRAVYVDVPAEDAALNEFEAVPAFVCGQVSEPVEATAVAE